MITTKDEIIRLISDQIAFVAGEIGKVVAERIQENELEHRGQEEDAEAEWREREVRREEDELDQVEWEKLVASHQ